MEIKHQQPIISDSAFVAEGAIIHGNVEIGEGSSIWYHATVRAECSVVKIGAQTNIQDNCVIHVDEETTVDIGDGVTIGHGAIIHGCHIGDNTVVGMGAIIMNHAVVGKNCIVAAGALITQNTIIPDNSLVIGSPGKVLRTTTPEEEASNKQNAQHYVEEAGKQLGFDMKYHLKNIKILEESPLKGKQLCFLGSSVTAGDTSFGVSFVEYIAKRNQCSCVKEALGGTTLADDSDNSYIQRMKKNLNTKQSFDAFICQLSTNDAAQGKRMGEISSETDLQSFDTSTIAGALEYIICYVKETWNCPMIFYTGTKYDSMQYEKMIELLYRLQKKWKIGIIDLWNNEIMNQISAEQYKLYMVDGVHPTQAGYLEWWTPVIERDLAKEI